VRPTDLDAIATSRSAYPFVAAVAPDRRQVAELRRQRRPLTCFNQQAQFTAERSTQAGRHAHAESRRFLNGESENGVEKGAYLPGQAAATT